MCVDMCPLSLCCLFFQAEDGIRDLVRSRGLGDVYKRQGVTGQHRGGGRAVARVVGGFGRLRPARVGEPGDLSLIHI